MGPRGLLSVQNQVPLQVHLDPLLDVVRDHVRMALLVQDPLGGVQVVIPSLEPLQGLFSQSVIHTAPCRVPGLPE